MRSSHSDPAPASGAAGVVPAALVDMQTKAGPAAARLRTQAKARTEHLRMIVAQAEGALPDLSPAQQQQQAIALAVTARRGR
jgi:hypothetical protein